MNMEKCSIEKCEKPIFMAGKCQYHYQAKYIKNSKQNRKLKLIQIIGGNHCSCDGSNCWHNGPCIVNDTRCLQIDHKNGGGVKQIRVTFGENLGSMYSHYLKNEDKAKKELQVLCANCNWVKRVNNNEL